MKCLPLAPGIEIVLSFETRILVATVGFMSSPMYHVYLFHLFYFHLSVSLIFSRHISGLQYALMVGLSFYPICLILEELR